ncbi:SSI family serine proteinase inhibitor [Streptomyces sp. NPDC049040]|uniref:SSI family serine proteinase inhibitor n=1 Tax=Streptomyces sp. NPDC049040 TaxID=3365593 RepID=UPI00371B3B54
MSRISRRSSLPVSRRVGLQMGLRVRPAVRPPYAPPGSRLRAGLVAAVLGLTALGALPAAGPAGAVGLPRPGVVGIGDRLAISYDDGAGGTVTRILTCGDVEQTAEQTGVEEQDACRRLEELGGPLAPVQAGQMCSMIYGGPQTAHVTGMWHGVPVDETYRRTDGCEVARWNRMVPALPSPTPGTDGGPHIFAA